MYTLRIIVSVGNRRLKGSQNNQGGHKNHTNSICTDYRLLYLSVKIIYPPTQLPKDDILRDSIIDSIVGPESSVIRTWSYLSRQMWAVYVWYVLYTLWKQFYKCQQNLVNELRLNTNVDSYHSKYTLLNICVYTDNLLRFEDWFCIKHEMIRWLVWYDSLCWPINSYYKHI